MHVLMVSLDTTFLTQTIGDSRARHEAYAEQVGRISMVICNRRAGEPLPGSRSLRVAARATESRSYLHFLLDGYRMGVEFHREAPVDLVATQDPFLTALVGLRLRRRLGVPLVIQVNTSVVDNRYFARARPHNRLLQRLARWTLRRADAVRVLNEEERRACIRHGVRPDRVSVAPIATDISRFRTLAPEERLDAWRRRLGIEPHTPVALWVGRPDPVKDLPTLLDAFGRVHQRLPEARLILAGNLEQTTIPRQIAALGLSDVVHLPGAVVHSELPSLYQIATAYVHSSHYEGLGLVMIEAAAAGLPVISTATDGARDIVVDGETGTLVPIGDALALADGLVDVLSDRDRARRMGERGRQHVVKRYDQVSSAASWIGVWRSVLAGARPRD